jgi:serine/threonine-protein kinase
VVISANPGPGAQIRKDGAVELVVSQGVRTVVVPSGLVGKQRDQAAAALTAAELTLGSVTQEYDNNVPTGQVTAATHNAGDALPHGSSVGLTVSAGPVPVTVTQQVGRTKDDAEAALVERGLVVTYADPKPSEAIAEGRVMDQSISSGTTAHWGDTITLTVSSGMPIVEVPNVVGMTTVAATDLLRAAGFEVQVERALGGFFGLVRSQDVTGTARKGTTITITVV